MYPCLIKIGFKNLRTGTEAKFRPFDDALVQTVWRNYATFPNLFFPDKQILSWCNYAFWQISIETRAMLQQCTAGKILTQLTMTKKPTSFEDSNFSNSFPWINIFNNFPPTKVEGKVFSSLFTAISNFMTYCSVLFKWELPIMPLSFHQKRGAVERGWVQVGSSHLNEKFSFE